MRGPGKFLDKESPIQGPHRGSLAYQNQAGRADDISLQGHGSGHHRSAGRAYRHDVRADSGRAMSEKCVLQLAGSMRGNAGILGFGLENACA
jgi:hypothetical protein